MDYPLKGRIGSVTTLALDTEVKSTFGAFGLAVKNGKVLLAKRDDRPGVSYPGWWNLPGGGAKGNEGSPLAVLGREFKEETRQEITDVRGQVGRALQAFIVPRLAVGDPLVVDTAVAYLVTFAGEPQLTDESREFRWFGYDEIRAERMIVGRDKNPIGRTLTFVLWGLSLAQEPLYSGLVDGSTLRQMFSEQQLIPGPDYQLVNDDRYLVRLTPEHGQLRLSVWHNLSLHPSADKRGILPGDSLRLP